MRSMLRTFVAVLTVLAIPISSLSPALAGAPASGRLEGKILAAVGGPVEGAVIMVRSLEDLTEHASAPTGADGGYVLGGLPGGEYEIAVKTEKGLYLGARSLKVSAMGSQTYSFRIEDRPRAEILSLAQPDGDDEGGEGEPEEPKKKKKGAGILWWDNPLLAVAAGLAFVIGTSAVIEAVDDEDDDEDDDGSPSGR